MSDPGDDDGGRIEELARRWRLARLAALRLVTPIADASDEILAAEAALRVDETLTLRKVYDHSFALGASFARFHQLVLEPRDLGRLAAHITGPCGVRGVVHHDAHVELTRSACPSAAGMCRYHREAFDGLVTGSSDGEVCFRRHRARDDDSCLDVLYVRQGATDALRFGEIPTEMVATLAQITRRLAVLPGVTVTFRGYSDRTLFYEASAQSADMATDRVVQDAVARRFVNVRAQSTAPRAVLAEA